MEKINSEIIIKKGKYGYEAWQTNKLLAQIKGFTEDSKETLENIIKKEYDNVIEIE